MEKNPIKDYREDDSWINAETGEPVRALLRDWKGEEALQKAEELNIRITSRLIMDALDATSGRLAFARQENDEEKIQEIKAELQRITEKYGDPFAKSV